MSWGLEIKRSTVNSSHHHLFWPPRGGVSFRNCPSWGSFQGSLSFMKSVNLQGVDWEEPVKLLETCL